MYEIEVDYEIVNKSKATEKKNALHKESSTTICVFLLRLYNDDLFRGHKWRLISSFYFTSKRAFVRKKNMHAYFGVTERGIQLCVHAMKLQYVEQ